MSHEAVAEDPARALVDATGRPVAVRADRRCPQCGASASRRVASSGFGTPHPVCGQCGHDFRDELMT